MKRQLTLTTLIGCFVVTSSWSVAQFFRLGRLRTLAERDRVAWKTAEEIADQYEVLAAKIREPSNRRVDQDLLQSLLRHAGLPLASIVDLGRPQPATFAGQGEFQLQLVTLRGAQLKQLDRLAHALLKEGYRFSLQSVTITAPRPKSVRSAPANDGAPPELAIELWDAEISLLLRSAPAEDEVAGPA